MKKKANIAIIGTGALAQGQHLPNMFKLDNAELYAICDRDRKLLDQIGDEYGVDRRETDHRKILNNPEIDGVIIVTKADSHMPLTVEALKAGKHVYVEKPLAETEEECHKITEAQKETGKLVAVGMNRRMAPAYRYAKELLWKQGGPKNMFYRISDAYSIQWGIYLGKGNRMFHETCHIFDIMRFFADSEVKSVYCLSVRPDDEQIMLEFESGTVGTIMSSGYVKKDMPKEHFEAIAEVGGLTIEDFSEVRQYSLDKTAPGCKNFAGHNHPKYEFLPEFLLRELGADAMRAIRKIGMESQERFAELEAAGKTDCAEYRQLKAAIKKMVYYNYFMDKGWTDAIKDFAEAILNSRDFQGATAYDGLQAIRLTEAAIKSRESKQVVIL